MKKSAQDTCLTQQTILRYLSETLSQKETYRTESHLIDCAVCNRAVEQYACTHNFSEDATQAKNAEMQAIR